MKGIKSFVKEKLYKAPPERLLKNFKSLTHEAQIDFEKILMSTYYKDYNADQLNDMKGGIKDQLTGRLQKFREQVVPWLDDAKHLNGSSILEVGCGTGSSTVAFAEQGAHVTAVDLDEDSLTVAKKRVSLHGVNANFVLGNGQEIDKMFQNEHFDVIIFSATLEHMTYTERVSSLKAAYSLMKSGDLLSVVETPNRLWFYDFHTALLPFYFWLPDELAFDYASRSSRTNFSEVYKEKTPEKLLHFVRRGRGVSFHDFEIAFDGISGMNVVSCLETFRKKKFLRFITDRLKARGYVRYKNFIQNHGPAYHEGFYEPWLDLIFQKT
jgi:2-polyprenyl-3-methyl-5-hydroxy-6-metoxy-1,4-benzoquinol methylase